MAVADARLTRQLVEAVTKGTSQARLTQQVVETVSKGTSEARLTQLVVEVIMQTGNWARLSQQVIEVITNAPIVRSGSDTITVTEDNDSDIVSGTEPIDRSGEDVVTISETDVYEFIHNRSFDDEIEILESNSTDFVIYREGEDEITIDEETDTSISELDTVEDLVEFTEENEYLLLGLSTLEDTVTITETNERVVIFERSGEDLVDFVETNKKRFSRIAEGEDNLTVTDIFFGERHDGEFEDEITITEVTTSERILSRAATDSITITDVAEHNTVLLREATDVINVVDGAPKLIDGVFVTIPGFIASVVNPCTGVSSTRYCILSGINTSVVLPRPLFDDSEANTDQMQVFRTSTNRRVITVKRQSMRTLSYQFRLTRKKAIELQNLIRYEIDNQVMWRNWKGEIWIGTLSNNPFVVTADGRWGPCTEGMTVELELKAVRIH